MQPESQRAPFLKSSYKPVRKRPRGTVSRGHGQAPGRTAHDTKSWHIKRCWTSGTISEELIKTTLGSLFFLAKMQEKAFLYSRRLCIGAILWRAVGHISILN